MPRRSSSSQILPAAIVVTAGALLQAPNCVAQQLEHPPGPYLGIEGGANWQDPQDWRENRAVFDRLKFKSGWIAGVTAGYALPMGLRTELELDHRQNTLNREVYSSARGSSLADSAMLNLWYDVRRPSGLLSVLHPYLGGAVGAVRTRFHDANLAGFPIASDQATEFAYQAGAGVSYDVSQHVAVSLDYRRLWSNRAEYHDDPAGLLPAPGGYDHRYLAETAMLSVRYQFGSRPAPIVQALPPPPPALPPPTAAPVIPPPCVAPAGFQVDQNCRIIEQTLVVRAIDFQFGSAQLTVPAQQTLDEVARALVLQNGLQLGIKGYTDSVGSIAANLTLSQRRADAVKRYLLEKGVAASRLSARGYGKSDPIASNATPEGRAKNRRVAFQLTNAPDHVRVESRDATVESTEAAEVPATTR